jgi:hypothetical protein
VSDLSEKRPWPPVYDSAQLASTIRQLSKGLPKDFYLPSITDLEPCQGDVFALNADVPVIGADADAVVIEPAQHWLVLANTCDVSRAFDGDGDVDYIAVVPIFPATELDDGVVQNAQACLLTRLFYLPPWDGSITAHIADFTCPVSMHREAARNHAKIVARMRLESWVLLNASLVRTLCREDRRNV